MKRPARIDLLDRRQRRAAALLLSAIDLPAEMHAVGRQWEQAAKVCPGLGLGELDLNSRAGALRKARDLIDQMLAEIPAPAATPETP